MAATALFGLLLCPVCRRDWSGSGGCCRHCRTRLFGSGAKGFDLPGLLALGYYRGELARAVRAYKYLQVRNLAPLFATSLAAQVQVRGWRPGTVTYVPLHAGRRRQRGFDQASLLAGSLAARLSVPCRPLLERTRATPQQARLVAAERRQNVHRAFRASGPASGTVLLVDDVFTTGATLGACREVLEAAGARAVLLAVLAVAPRSGGSQREMSTPLVIPNSAPTST